MKEILYKANNITAAATLSRCIKLVHNIACKLKIVFFVQPGTMHPLYYLHIRIQVYPVPEKTNIVRCRHTHTEAVLIFNISQNLMLRVHSFSHKVKQKIELEREHHWTLAACCSDILCKWNLCKYRVSSLRVHLCMLKRFRWTEAKTQSFLLYIWKQEIGISLLIHQRCNMGEFLYFISVLLQTTTTTTRNSILPKAKWSSNKKIIRLRNGKVKNKSTGKSVLWERRHITSKMSPWNVYYHR